MDENSKDFRRRSFESMRFLRDSFQGRYRWAAIIAATVACALGAFAIVLSPDLLPLIVPNDLRRHPSEGFIFVLFLGYCF